MADKHPRESVAPARATIRSKLANVQSAIPSPEDAIRQRSLDGMANRFHLSPQGKDSLHQQPSGIRTQTVGRQRVHRSAHSERATFELPESYSISRSNLLKAVMSFNPPNRDGTLSPLCCKLATRKCQNWTRDKGSPEAIFISDQCSSAGQSEKSPFKIRPLI